MSRSPQSIFDGMLSARPVLGTKPIKVESWGRPRYPVPDPPSNQIPIGEVPEGLLPVDPDPAELTLLGEVCGQPIFARTDAVARARQIHEMHPERGNWPADALRATIHALRTGMTPRPSYREIARMLNMSERHVLRTAKRGRKDAVVERELARLDSEGFPMAVENVLEGLQDRDKDYTLKFLEMRGAKKGVPGTEGAQPQGAFPGLVVQFVHDGNTPVAVRPGSITANPNLALAPVIEAEKVAP